MYMIYVSWLVIDFLEAFNINHIMTHNIYFVYVCHFELIKIYS